MEKGNIDFLKDEEKSRLIVAIDQSAVSIIMTDIYGNIQYCNPAFEQVTGYSLEEIMGENPRILKSGLVPDEIFKDMWETITRGQDWKGDLINKKKDGTIYYEEVRITPITDEKGEIVNFLGVRQDISRRKYLEEKLKQTSIRDNLTNLYNRGYVFERLRQCIEIFKRNGEEFSLAIIDMDFFKDINDTYGHQAGDFILKEFSEIITSSIRVYDIAGRYGGEEFIIILQGVRKRTSAKIIKRILEKMRNSTFDYEDNEIKITFSCGICDISEIDKDSLSIESLIYKADKRLYDAKNTGRNRIIMD
ncbi:diguanylate cyclase [Tissierella praeacuta]|uniref:diguanylate cyclase n=1 Tax=Tissierella praeacuta TaxID=43131 RepID=UPI003341453E